MKSYFAVLAVTLQLSVLDILAKLNFRAAYLAAAKHHKKGHLNKTCSQNLISAPPVYIGYRRGGQVKLRCKRVELFYCDQAFKSRRTPTNVFNTGTDKTLWIGITQHKLFSV